jgi:peptidoglycan/xylan/chitin deacetylase (PgdA/CDA1 family)
MRTAGVFGRSGRSQWRHDRLLILGYHGIAQYNEHLWAPALFITAELFENRLEFLRSSGFNILPLETALRHLREGTLPERSVSLTFDDGYVDFYRIAHPILKAYKAPATVYLTTYYSERNLPIPGITAAYMVWMSRHFVGPLKTIPAFGHIDLRQPDRRRQVSTLIGEYFTDERIIATTAKHELLEALADELGFNLRSLRAQRLMHLMSPEEVGDLARDGIDFQLHSHRHWVPEEEALIRREIIENRERIEAITGRPAVDFCYPSGVHYPELLGWLRNLNIRSATTCESGLAAASDDPLMLPRFLDHSRVSQTEFEAWATGALRAFPRRSAYSPPPRPASGTGAHP